ncbi:hypothetical protein CB1_000259025 [Camelus ferus]|nr:hypothetical protein CB1_000259025 [Camelus ferus]
MKPALFSVFCEIKEKTALTCVMGHLAHHIPSLAADGSLLPCQSPAFWCITLIYFAACHGEILLPERCRRIFQGQRTGSTCVLYAAFRGSCLRQSLLAKEALGVHSAPKSFPRYLEELA